MFLLTELKRFQTKRKSSDPATWVAWSAILCVSIVITSVLALTQVRMMSTLDVRFFNVRASTLEDFRGAPSAAETVLDGKTPLVFLGRDKLVLGSSLAVTAPRPDADVVVLDSGRWRQELVPALKRWKRVREVFPARTVAVAAPVAATVGESAETLGALVEALTEINNWLSTGEPFGAPVPVYVSVKPKMMASTERVDGH